MTTVLRPGECVPDFRWWWTGVVEECDGRQFRVAFLKLPSWQVRVDPVFGRPMWYRLVLIYRGDTLFQFQWWRDE